jgi:DNA-binding response OmpR family regulator
VNRILIIEDQREMRENLATILEMESYVVLRAANGREALELARSERPDLVLCDVMMPHLDGHAVLQALRGGRHRVIPFIFLTAKGDKRDQRTSLGADDYLRSRDGVRPAEHRRRTARARRAAAGGNRRGAGAERDRGDDRRGRGGAPEGGRVLDGR